MDFYQMVLNIIPGNIISPFQTGNALQIIFSRVYVVQVHWC